MPCAVLALNTPCDLDGLRPVYQDSCLVAMHKPAALLVHRSPIDRRETQFALQMTRDLIGQRVYPLHRLDKATSGLLLFALDPQTARCVGEQFARHSVRKTYLALVRGWPPVAGEVDRPLLYQRDRLGDRDKQESLEPQPALTTFRTLATTTLDLPLGRYPQQRYALVEARPLTGRKHQIRRHLRHINHPIIGDVNHGDRHHNHLYDRWRGYHRLYLAATQIDMEHPVSGQPLQIRAPLQPDFQATLDALGLSEPVLRASASSPR